MKIRHGIDRIWQFIECGRCRAGRCQSSPRQQWEQAEMRVIEEGQICEGNCVGERL